MHNKIKPGDEIIHPTWGSGIVVRCSNYVEINFDSVGPKIFTMPWLITNCIVVQADSTAKSVQQIEAEETADSILQSFNKFKLSPASMQELKDFFVFKENYLKYHRKKLRYHLLIQCENDDEAQLLLTEIEKALKKIGALEKGVVRATEQEILDNIPTKFPEKCSLLMIRNCEGIEKDSVAIISSTSRANIQHKKQRKDRTWNTIVKLSDQEPDCTVLAVGSKEFVTYLQQNDHLYYRFFAHRITLRPMNTEEIMEAISRGIKNEQLSATPAFDQEIEKYIRKVYPGADLRDRAFIQDLLNRIFVNYYTYENNGIISERCVPFYRKPKSFDEISEQLNQYVGLQQVKKEFRRLYELSADEFNNNKQRLHFAFVGNPGTGKTTIANLTAELLFSMGLIRKNKIVVVAPTDVISVYKGESGQLMQEKIDEARGGVLFIDEAYFLISKTTDANSPQKQCLEVILQEMEGNSHNLSVIFAGYEDEIQHLLSSNPGLKSRVPYVFKFDDYSAEEMLQIFLNLASRENMDLAPDAHPLLLERMALAKTEENFGNARTVANLYQQLKAVWVEQNRKARVFTTEDIRATMPVPINTNLDAMIGLADVKQELKVFESRIKYIKFLKEKNLTVPTPNLHMMFTGNPGTGKTTVAKKIADCLYQIGILKTNKLVIAERKDLVAEIVGGTAQKTNEVIKKAINGVLFIDEAYSLYREDNARDFGTEAIETLITAMEEYKDRLVVVLAGYRDEMQTFQKANPGISSRIGFTFHFPDYSPDELTQIFLSKMDKQGFRVASNAYQRVYKVMEYFSAMENFGNGRFVDRVIDMTISNRSFRTYVRRFNDISEEDIPEIKDLARVSSTGHNLELDDNRSDELQHRIAVHEIGHAIVSCILSPQRKIVTISINADADSAGRTAFGASDDNITESGLKSRLAIAFGGRNAERVIFGEHSSGCASDVTRAKKMAEYMIETLAVGEFGVTTPLDLLKEADHIAMTALENNKTALILLSDKLRDKGTMSGDEIRSVLCMSNADLCCGTE